jgi:hypothetical protein
MNACGGDNPNIENASVHSRSRRRAKAVVLKYMQWSNIIDSILDFD